MRIGIDTGGTFTFDVGLIAGGQVTKAPRPMIRPGADRFELRRLYCPACAAQVDVQIALADAPLLESAEML